MAVKIVAIADIHYKRGSLRNCGRRRSAVTDILLLRAVNRINRWIKPDVVIILGDLIDDSSSPDALRDLRRLKRIADRIKSPVIAVPGNHDLDIDRFYNVFSYPGQVVDIKEARFVLFFDPSEPNHNARRTDAGLHWMSSAAEGRDGPVVSVQHVPLFPPGASGSPYAYTNAKEVWSVFEQSGYTLALSAHYHAGDDILARGGGPALIVPALCEQPFAFVEIMIDGRNIHTQWHQLAVPSELELVDYHVHTPFAYCQENMNMGLSIRLAREFGLANLSFTEHSGQLYFDNETFWSAAFMPAGIDTEHGVANRMPEFISQARKFCPPAMLGLEIDCDYVGRPVVRQEDLLEVDVRLGSVHWLEELTNPEPDLARAGDEMVARLKTFLSGEIQILAHPFRAFQRKDLDLPENLMSRLVELLRERNVAAEVNFHTQETSEEFVKACMDAGVKLVFGSDAHNLYEIGEFQPHLDLLERCGCPPSRLNEVLADFRKPIASDEQTITRAGVSAD